MVNQQPPARLLRAARRPPRGANRSPRDEQRISDAHREILRGYRAIAASGQEPGKGWRAAALKALSYLGGDADRHYVTLRDYDHRRYGPFLGVSDDGEAAPMVRRAAWASPKARALRGRASPLTIGVGLDAARLGGIGEVAVGPDEFADIWCDCIDRSLMTSLVGSRVNVRHYLPPPLVTIAHGPAGAVLDAARKELAEKFKPFLDTPDQKPRPLVVFVEFALKSKRRAAEQRTMLEELATHIRSGGIAAPQVHKLGLNVRIGWGEKGRDAAIRAIDLARSAGIREVSIDGVVRKEADRALSFPGLTNYLAPDLVSDVLRHARQNGVRVHPLVQVDPDTIARSIWSTLNTARGMSLHFCKYGVYPLTLEECQSVVSRVQPWFSDWAAAPAFYVDQGIISDTGVYVDSDRAKGAAKWLQAMAKHKVKVVLIDTIDKSKGWKLLRTGDDKKGLLSAQEISRLAALGEKLGIKVLWAGGITGPQAYELGKLGVFGIYVTTAAAKAVAVEGRYGRDPGLPARKQVTFSGVLNVKTLLEAGYLSQRVRDGAALNPAPAGGKAFVEMPEDATLAQLAQKLGVAWREWWRKTGERPAIAPRR
jgi:hypothetical protein